MKSAGWSVLLTVFGLSAWVQMAAPDSPWREQVYTSADGLAETACGAVAIGPTGNVLVRHPNTNAISILDGYKIILISVPGQSYGRVYESHTGQLWTCGPLGLLNYNSGQWLNYKLGEIEECFRTGHTNEISAVPLKHGRVLVLLRDRLLLFEADMHTNTGRVTVVRTVDQTPLGQFIEMRMTSDGTLWIRGTNAFAKVTGLLRQTGLGESWLVTNAAPFEVDRRVLVASLTNTLPPGQILDVDAESAGAIWIATRRGLIRRSLPIWLAVHEVVAGEDVGPGAALAKRAAGASNVRELIELALQGEPAIEQIELALEDLGMTGPWTAALITENGDLWLGGINGTAVRRNGQWRVFASSSGINPGHVIGFAEAPDGRVCCGTPGTVWEFDGRGWIVLRSGLGRVIDLYFARDGTLWVATETGIYRSSRGAWVHNDENDGLPSNAVEKVWQVHSGRIYALTRAGPATFNPDADLDPPRSSIQPVGTDLSRIR